MGNRFSSIQQLGRALMLPIAVLPIAGLLLRLGQPDLLNIPFVAAAGDAIFGNLGLLFAIGVAVGFAKENHGAAGLAGAVGFVVAQATTKALIGVPPAFLVDVIGQGVDAAKAVSRISVPTGIIMGLIAGWLYNKYRDIKLPDYLAFFGGRRFVPIVTGFAALIVGFLLGVCWPGVSLGLDHLSRGVLSAGEAGLFLYGLFNRILIVTGLHHILNNLAWFIIGDYEYLKDGATTVATGDLNRFFAGDKTAGAFMAGYFPVMMFGLPAACLAMYHAAKPSRRAAVGGALFSMALTAFLTGVTEPVEFTFMFLAPVLYGIHAVLTGLSLVIMDVLNVKLGFGFSAGLFDYILNFQASTNPIMLLPVGAAYFLVYYGLFRFFIAKFNLKTLGREDDGEAESEISSDARGAKFVAALGGAGNIDSVQSCTTRVRVQLSDAAKADENALKLLGATGVVSPAPGALQIVVGTEADAIASEIHDTLMRISGVVPAPMPKPVPTSSKTVRMIEAMGGEVNIKEIEACTTRLRVVVADSGKVNEAALRALDVRGVVKPTADTVQVIIGPTAELVADEIKDALRKLRHS